MKLLLLISITIGQCLSQEELRMLSYTKLPSYPDPNHPAPVYKLYGDTAIDSAYDTTDNVLYVVGHDSPVVHVLDLSDPADPHLLVEHVFRASDGRPRGVDVCGGQLAVIMTSSSDVYEGHVQLYETYNNNVKQLWYLRSIPVGFHPTHVAFSKDCTTLTITNQGLPGRGVSGGFVDPEGSVTVLRKSTTGTWVTKTADFLTFNGRSDIRHPSQCVNKSYPVSSSLLSQDVEPSFTVFTQDGRTAYVSLQENNAIARMSVSRGEVNHIYDLGTKNWNLSRLDASDKDGGPNLATYPIYGLYQPRVIKLLQVATKTYLVTANEGKMREYTVDKHGFSWSEGVRAGSPGPLPLDVTNTTLLGQMNQDASLGRLLVSQCDGVGSSGLQKLHTFGGRGFSIWDTAHMSHPVYDSGAEIEEVNNLLLDNVFNTDVTSSVTSSPESMRDTTSDDSGPKITAMDLLEDHGKTYLILGSGTMGSLYLYTLDTRTLTTDLNHVLREGGTKQPVADMYGQGVAGNLGISDIRLVSSSDSPVNKTLVIVVSNVSGSVAVYEIVKGSV